MVPRRYLRSLMARRFGVLPSQVDEMDAAEFAEELRIMEIEARAASQR